MTSSLLIAECTLHKLVEHKKPKTQSKDWVFSLQYNVQSITNTNRPYLFSLNQTDTENELLAQNILKKIGFSSVENVKFLDSQMDFDCFKAVIEGQARYFKYSFDGDGSFFAHEYNILKQLAPFSPVAYKHGKTKYGESVQYIVTSFESADTVAEFGLSSVFEHNDSFLYTFDKLRGVKVDRTFSHYLNDLFARYDIEQLPEHSIAAIADHTNIDNLRSILKTLKNEVEYLSRQSFCKTSDFCHGKLIPDNILIKNNLFKFQHLQHGYMGNQLFDLCNLFINMGIPLEYQRQFAMDYKSLFPDFNEQQFIEEYNSCFNLMLRLFVYETIFNYLCEVYLYESSRPAKILQMVSVFLRNEEALAMIPSLSQYNTFLIRDIMEPLIGNPEQ